MRTEVSGDYKNFGRYTFNQDGTVINKTTTKPITLEGEEGKQYYRLTDDEGERKQIKLSEIIEHFVKLQNENARLDANDQAKKCTDEVNAERAAEGGATAGAANTEKPAKEPKAPKAPKEPKAEKPAYVPDPALEPKKPQAEGYTVVPLSNDKIRLTDDDIRQIRHWAWEGKAQKDIREPFNLHASTCSNIINRKLHPNLDKE